MNKILILRISCKAEKDRWDSFRKHNFDDLPQIIVCGDNSIHKPYKLVGDVLYLKCRDMWEDLPEKMICLYNAMKGPEFEQYEYFVKCDADIVPMRSFSKKKLYNKVKGKDYVGGRLHKPPSNGTGVYHLKKNLSKDSPWKGKACRSKDFRSTRYALGGKGYVLSKRAIVCMTKNYTADNRLKTRNEFIYEDSMVGILLKRHGIYPKQEQLFLTDRITNNTPRDSRRRRISRRKSRVGIISPNRSMALVRAGVAFNK